MWTTKISPAEQEETVQMGVDVIHDYASSIGLNCSGEKSEYVVVINDIASRASEYRGMVNLTIAGKPLPRRDSIKILGFFLHGRWKISYNHK